MTQHTKGAILTAGLALIFVAIEWRFAIRTGIAGVFVMGVAGGLLIGQEMGRSKPTGPAR